MSIYLPGLAIGGYRSFGSKVQRMGPLAKINIFVGANNSGKSNILRFLHSHIGQFRLPNPAGVNAVGFSWDVDGFVGSGDNLIAGLGCLPDNSHFNSTRKNLDSDGTLVFDKLVDCEPLRQNTECVWFDAEFDRKQNKVIPKDFTQIVEAPGTPAHREWFILAQRLYPNLTFPNVLHLAAHFLSDLNTWKLDLPRVYIIPAVRHIDDKSWGIGDIVGADMLSRLAELQSPVRARQPEREKFKAIIQFFREVSGNPEALIEIPSSLSEFNVRMDGKLLPLSSLGTGLHEVVILAVAASMVTESIICFEEPELHLHPILQRKLLRYLSEKTSNQYFITTHSAHLIDAVDSAACFRVQMQDGQTMVERAEAPGDRWEICRDLGYRASDLMQANCIIWVEGPTDRLYVRHWLAKEAPELIEGVDYSIMFYGGRLLCHLSADDGEVDDFIRLCRLNRNIAVVMDSDKATARSKINETKRRVHKEVTENGGHVWVTAGREIENYVSPEVLRKCVENVRSGCGRAVSDEKYGHAVPNLAPKRDKFVDKLKVAHEVTSQPAVLDRYDLKKQIHDLVQFIQKANE